MGQFLAKRMRAMAVAAVASAALAASPALAQDGGTTRIRAGAGVQTQPKYPGADKNEWSPMVDFAIAKGDEYFKAGAPDDSFSPSLVSSGGFDFGPAINIQGSRKESDVGAPVGRVGTTVEAGAFAQYTMPSGFRLRAEARQGIGGHKGTIGSLGADYVARDGDNYVFTIGPRVLLSSSKYQRAYFGVSPAAALATGLPVYDPDGGIHGIAAASGLQVALGGGIGMFGYGRYERLVGDARKSPIVREFGSANQLSAGIGLNYTFRMGN